MRTVLKLSQIVLIFCLVPLNGCVTIRRSVEFVTVTPQSNLSLLKAEIRSFHETGGYDAEVSKVARAAERFVELRSSFFKKPTVVFDLDDTLLSSYDFFERRDFAVNKADLNSYLSQGEMPGLVTVIEVLNRLVKQGIDVIIITERAEVLSQATRENLKKVGVTAFGQIFFMPERYDQGSIRAYKTTTRESLEQNGHTIIAIISSQHSSLEGGFTLGTFKLPNNWRHVD